MLAFNEGKVCEAIVRRLEAREQARRTDVAWPEAEHHPDPVELTWKLGPQLFALEHTGIEPFEGFVQLGAEAERHFEPIRTALKGTLPPEVIELHIPAKAMLGRKKGEIAHIQETIVAWVKQTAPTLPVRTYADYIGDIKPVSLPGVPFPVRLFRFKSIRQGGRFQIVHGVSGDREQARTDRIRRACDKKFPKLAAWKRNHGARTILVLEDNDIQLTNHAIVAETYLPLALARADRPDETYLVATCMDPWNAWPILIDERSLFDLLVDDREPRWEIDPFALTAVTAR